jgi:hypothetical protein
MCIINNNINTLLQFCIRACYSRFLRRIFLIKNKPNKDTFKSHQRRKNGFEPKAYLTTFVSDDQKRFYDANKEIKH